MSFITRNERGYYAERGNQYEWFGDDFGAAQSWMVSGGYKLDSQTCSDSGKPTWWYVDGRNMPFGV